MGMAAYGAYRTFSEGLPGRFAAAYAGMATVGLGSESMGLASAIDPRDAFKGF